MKSRAWCFTINNDTYSDMDSIIDVLVPKSRYTVFGFEVGKQGTPHIQGYTYFDSPRSLRSIKRILERAHLIPAKGNPQQNYDYTTKDGHWYEFGERISQGRACYERVKEAMENPKEHFHLYQQYKKTYQSLKFNTIKKDKMRLCYAVHENLIDDLIVDEVGNRDTAGPLNATADNRPTLTIDYTTGTPVNWTINSPTVDSDAGTVTLTVTLDAPAPGGGFSGLVNTYDITAVAGVDYTAQVNVPFSISAGNTTGNIVIPILP